MASFAESQEALHKGRNIKAERRYVHPLRIQEINADQTRQSLYTMRAQEQQFRTEVLQFFWTQTTWTKVSLFFSMIRLQTSTTKQG